MRTLNRKAPFEYQLGEKLEAGVALLGSEVKSVKEGRVDLTTSFVRFKNGEAWLFNANIFPYPWGTPENYDPTRSRRLLLNKDEIISLETKAKQQKLTIVPTKIYTKGQRIKVEIALAKSKRKFEQREAKRKQDIKRDIERELKE